MKKGQDGKWIPDEDWPENRTLHSFQQDIANLLAEEEDGASARVSGRDHHSISKRPILPLPSDIKQIVPPSLHIILGLVVRYFKLLETECRKLDQDGVQCRDEQLANTWQKSSEDAKQAEVLLHEAREALQEENDILDGLQKACRGRVRNGMVLQPCSMPLCKLHVSKPKGVNPKDIPWIQCVNCGEGDSKGWFHDFCVGMTEEDASSEENDGFVCPVCTGDVAGPNDVIEIQEERVAKQKEQVEQTNEDYENKKQVLDSVYEKVVNSRGSLEKQLNDKLENELHHWLNLWSVFAVFVVSTPLDDYVNMPDPHYNYTVLTNHTVRIAGSYTVYTINMTSQKWLTDNDSDRSIWWHYLMVTIPDEVRYPDAAYMYITGGGNGGPPDPLGDDEVLFTSLTAASMGIVTACLKQVPNQPIVFKKDPKQEKRTEDAIIAFTWAHFINNGTDEPYWLLRMPMTKAAVRAMDTISNYTSHVRPDLNISRFIVAGKSKRGWTTWTTGAVDKRVIAIVPIVLDCLNLVKNMHHFYRSLGGWTLEFADYWVMNITRELDNPNTQKMADIIDPLVYKDRLTMPKYIITTSGDEFFLPDDSHYYLNQMKGKTYIRITQNTEHELKGKQLDVLLNIRAFMFAVLEGWNWPVMNWTLSENATHGTIEFHTNVKPLSINTWMAQTLESDGRRDFRLVAAKEPGSTEPVLHPVIYEPYDVSNPSPGVYFATFERPLEGWRCFFIRATYTGPKENTFLEFTSEANIIPDGVFPVPDCHGEDCYGTLV
ncbi:autocrine proliferation repressor protein A-like [Amphiura filiformis]|uniref:autocrine proliferation repressor protein A-like n=1 Tax=Amphiura filiformis TaxID=82378 RepID=UPI003B20D627